MKIVVLNGSPRKTGNTTVLVNSFCDGAKESDHEIIVLPVSDKNIAPCKGCNACMKNGGVCVQKDEMKEVYDVLKEAECIVVATPLYFYGISGQLKCLIDRLHNPVRDSFKVKKLALLATAGSSKPFVFDALVAQYQVVREYFSLADGGVVKANACRGEGVVADEYLHQAFEIGKNI